ncbi:hypothetical protein IE53DRAFT_333803 [Violaceomyces palustris]|uniref:Uncharacterized protein n=1 Tax=Violaceomyces palustris TaxID=1673888 RepID=A0ACD0NRF1_9BASI|nr:hypothetical protein IE53DRAFT_333803 [Violaceomyces palustris]
MNTIQTHFWAVRDYLSPVLRESKFKEHGRITPEEFVAAGDFLSYKFPTWSWCSGDAGKARDYLPKDKQFLISRGVPSLRRVSQIEKGSRLGGNDKDGGDGEKLMRFDHDGQGTGSEDDAWVATHFDESGGTFSNSTDIVDIPDSEHDPTAPEESLTSVQEDDLANRVAGLGFGGSRPGEENDSTVAGDKEVMPEIGDIPDIDDEDLEGMGGLGDGVVEEEDPATLKTEKVTSDTGTDGDPRATADEKGESSKLLSVRTYDCLITYDKYYQTPRMWLVGYDEHGVPLKPAQIFEDVSSDYAQKTVTIEPFPHGNAGPDMLNANAGGGSSSGGGPATASIHPCKHASVMKKVIERMNASVVEQQRKAREGINNPSPNASSTGVEKKKRKGWGIGGAVRKVTGGTAASSSSSSEKATTNTNTSSSTSKDATDATNEDGGGADDNQVEGLRVDQYMIIFLKFMASIVPAIEIDATQAV